MFVPGLRWYVSGFLPFSGFGFGTSSESISFVCLVFVKPPHRNPRAKSGTHFFRNFFSNMPIFLFCVLFFDHVPVFLFFGMSR
jgi:hypothetical protein